MTDTFVASLLIFTQEIPLSEVLRVRGPAHLSVPSLPGNSAHSFELVTASLVYCVEAGEEGRAWESAIRQALMPVHSSPGCREEEQGELSTTKALRLLIYSLMIHLLIAGKGRHRDSVVRICLQTEHVLVACSAVLKCVCVCVFQDISSVYQIFTDEVLGSGQFGVVYRGESMTTVLHREAKIREHRSISFCPQALTGNQVDVLPSKSLTRRASPPNKRDS